MGTKDLQQSDALIGAAIELALDDALRDAGQMSNWLAGECTHYTAPWRPSTRLCNLQPDHMPTGDLLVTALDAGQPDDTRLAAANALRQRWLHVQEVAIAHAAAKVADEMATFRIQMGVQPC